MASMNIVWWSTASLVITAAVIDLRCRRIPNWLVIPCLSAGVIFSVEQRGLAGLGKSLGGIALATLALGVLVWLRAMGMGDLKLCAAVGAWVGFTQLAVALVATAIAGGVMALLWTTRNRAVKESLDGAGELLFGLPRRGFRPHPTLVLDNPQAHAMPYAPAIAMGTLFSFFCG